MFDTIILTLEIFEHSMTKIYPDFEQPRLINQLVFEINSWIGRYFFKSTSRFIPGNGPFLIDLGAGLNYVDGWIHVDFYRSRIRKFWKSKPKRRKPDVETDLRYPINCPCNIADGVYSSHTLEHLFPNHAYQLLSEIFRILKPGCWLRIAVPDLGKIVEYYNGGNEQFNYKFKAEAISNYTQNWGHHSAWDFELLSKALEIMGFINIRQVDFGVGGTDKRLIKEEEVRKFETLVVEGQKPF